MGGLGILIHQGGLVHSCGVPQGKPARTKRRACLPAPSHCQRSSGHEPAHPFTHAASRQSTCVAFALILCCAVQSSAQPLQHPLGYPSGYPSGCPSGRPSGIDRSAPDWTKEGLAEPEDVFVDSLRPEAYRKLNDIGRFKVVLKIINRNAYKNDAHKLIDFAERENDHLILREMVMYFGGLITKKVFADVTPFKRCIESFFLKPGFADTLVGLSLFEFSAAELKGFMDRYAGRLSSQSQEYLKRQYRNNLSLETSKTPGVRLGFEVANGPAFAVKQE